MNSKTQTILKCLELLKKTTKDMTQPMSVMLVQDFGRDPFVILILSHIVTEVSMC